MNTSALLWPNGKRVAVATAIMFETYPPGVAPKYSVQTTSLKPGTVDHAGIAWSSYGGRTGIWRIINTLDRLAVPATFFVNSRCVEEYPRRWRKSIAPVMTSPATLIRRIVCLTYMTVDEQRATIRESLDQLESCRQETHRMVYPVLAFTPRLRAVS